MFMEDFFVERYDEPASTDEFGSGVWFGVFTKREKFQIATMDEPR